MDRLSMEQGKMVDKCGSVVTRIFLDKMLKMVKTMAKALVKTIAKVLVKTMGKTTTEIDLMIARFLYIPCIYISMIIYYYISFTIQFSTNIIIHALYKNTQCMNG